MHRVLREGTRARSWSPMPIEHQWYANFSSQHHPPPRPLTHSCSSRMQKQAGAGARFSIFVPAIDHGALKPSAPSAAIGTQWCVSWVGDLSEKDRAYRAECPAGQPARACRHTNPADTPTQPLIAAPGWAVCRWVSACFQYTHWLTNQREGSGL
jgi:hypothetical protein